MAYSAPLLDRLNTRCQQLFGETVEPNFQAPAAVESNELLGLEYLFSQSTGASPFILGDLQNEGPGPDEEVQQPGQCDAEDEAYESGEEGDTSVADVLPHHIVRSADETGTAHPPALVSTLLPCPGLCLLACSVLALSKSVFD